MADVSDATVPLAAAPTIRAYRGFTVEVVEGPDRGKRAVAKSEELEIGTAAGNDLRLTDETVSRHHCAVTLAGGRAEIRDLGSMNGVRLGSHQIALAYLKDGASFRLGRSKLRFRFADGEITETLSAQARFGRMIGQSDAMRRIFALLVRIAPSDTTLLLEGETGTGKRLLAEAIHDASPRARAPFMVIDCAAIPAPLIESELFGHRQGAFTGAEHDRTGAFESVRGGTIFLDEVGELPLDLQPRLLRALEEKTAKRVGDDDPYDLDLRLIAATNRDLRTEVNAGTFRADLFYRLNVSRTRIPPLRERPEDVRLLVQHFYEQFSPADPIPSPELLDALERKDWPGNVRELRAAVERALLLGTAALGMDDAPLSTEAVEGFDPAVPFCSAKERAVSRWEEGYLASLLQQAGGDVSKAARMARMDRNHLRELLHHHGLSAPKGR